MKSLALTLFLAFAVPDAVGQDSPLLQLTVTTTRFSCASGFAVVTYGFRPSTLSDKDAPLDFVVIETSRRNSSFKRNFHLNKKVDDVTPPAYIDVSDGVVDLPHDCQLHELLDHAYKRADSNVTLPEIRSWLDQPPLRPSIDSLLHFKAKQGFNNRNADG